jgi:putative nucleotidyltransferase with HDIG domain
MEGTETSTQAELDRDALAALGRALADCVGVEVAFFEPDGSPAAGPTGAADGRLARLARRAADTASDCLEPVDGGLAAAWPVRQRSRTLLVAAAVLATPDAEAGRRLLGLVGQTVRARLALTAAQSEREALAEALAQSFEEVTLLHDLGEALCITQPVDRLLQRGCADLCDCTGAEAVAACLPAVEAAPATVVVAGRLPFDPARLPGLIAGVLDDLGPDRFMVIHNHCQDDPALAALSIALERLVVVPLALRGGTSGALVAVNRPTGEFGSAEAKLVRSVAGSCAVFIENHRLYRDLRDLMLDLVRALVSSIDAKDPYTSGHSERVAFTCRELARRMALSTEEVEQVYLAGLLHDIGKIGTPEAILTKAGLLDAEERRIINRHPVVSARILGSVHRLQPIRLAVLHHHERLDGSGYPEGLRGDAIPLLARIVGLADAFDAMTSNRPYRPMLPLEYVVREIERNVGIQFDLRVVDALMGLGPARLMEQFAQRPTAAVPELLVP